MIARILEILQDIPIFGGISERALQHILGRVSSLTFKKGDFLIRENDLTSSMLVLLNGKVSVIKSINGSTYELCQLDTGDCIGELELIDLCPRAASVRALENCVAIEITLQILHEIYDIDEESFAMIHMNMGREVSRRLQKLDADMLKVRIQGEEFSN